VNRDAALNEHKVRFLLIGGWAVGIYGHPRATNDIDFLIVPLMAFNLLIHYYFYENNPSFLLIDDHHEMEP
jgi:hypothetical protein